MLVNAHIEEEHANNMVANSLTFRISQDTLHMYMGLLNYLAGANNTRGWEAYYVQGKHYAEKIGLICGKFRNRVQMIAKLYIYLRDR